MTPVAATAPLLLALALHPPSPAPGQVALLALRTSPTAVSVEASVEGRPLHLVRAGEGWEALVGIDLFSKPGPRRIRVEARSGEESARGTLRFRVRPKRYPMERLKLPPEKVELSPEDLARVEREKGRLDALWTRDEAPPLWASSERPFVEPVTGGIIGRFGLRRVINGEPRSPHTGEDRRAPEGEPVVSAGGGVVALVDELFFSGRSVVVDHGGGLYTMYFHLSSTEVKPGDRVERGAILGRAGMTGRATGPHLHWGVRLQGARVDPESLLGVVLE